MYRTTGLPNTRIRVADALRGIAVAGIILIHACEHFNLYWAGLPYRRALVEGLEEPVAGFMWWLLAGKMYTIFALLFGLSFYVQSDNQAQRGRSFTRRFTWRMVLLLGIGLVNTAFYNGDVLVLYALLGVLLPWLGKLPPRWLWALFGILALQPLLPLPVLLPLIQLDVAAGGTAVQGGLAPLHPQHPLIHQVHILNIERLASAGQTLLALMLFRHRYPLSDVYTMVTYFRMSSRMATAAALAASW